MTTNEINTTRNHLFRGEFATELVAAVRERLQAKQSRRNRRIIAIGRSVAGQSFQVTAPPDDFVAAIDEVMSHPLGQWTEAQHAEVDNEVIGEEFSRTPFLY